MSEPLPCPSCGNATGGVSPCPRCGVAFAPVVGQARREPVEADFTRVLIVLGILAGLLVGAAIGWRVAMEGSSDRAEVETPAAATIEDEAPVEVEDEAPVEEPVEEPPDDPPGITAAELLAQEELVEPSEPVAVRPPALDVSAPTDAPPLVNARPASRPGWFDGDAGYQRALLEREKRDVPLVVYFHTDWCAYCKRMDEDFLGDDDVAAWLLRALRVEVNPEDGDAELALAREFGIRGYPGFFVLAPGQTEARRVHPFRRGRTIPTKQFLSELRDAAGEK